MKNKRYLAGPYLFWSVSFVVIPLWARSAISLSLFVRDDLSLSKSFFIFSFGFFCVFGNIPRLSRYKSTGYSSVGAIIANTAYRNIPFFCNFGNRQVSHCTHLVYYYILIGKFQKKPNAFFEKYCRYSLKK